MSSPASSFGQNSGEYSTVPGFGSPYIPTSEPCEPWTPRLNYAPSVVSSPTSSVANADDYITGYIPTSMPASMMAGGTVMSQASVPCIDKARKCISPWAKAAAWNERLTRWVQQLHIHCQAVLPMDRVCLNSRGSFTPTTIRHHQLFDDILPFEPFASPMPLWYNGRLQFHRRNIPSVLHAFITTLRDYFNEARHYQHKTCDYLGIGPHKAEFTWERWSGCTKKWVTAFI